MKKLIAFFIITILFSLGCQPFAAAVNPAAATPGDGSAIGAVLAASPDYVTLVHSGITYTIAQASSPDSNYPYSVEKKNDVLHIIDKASGIRSDIIYESLNAASFDALRDYYNDSSLTDDELFSRYTGLVKSYITASESLYNANNINGGETVAETAMRFYCKDMENLFGLDGCSVYLYNIVRFEGLDYSEQAYLHLVIPDRSSSTVIMIKFTIPLGKMGMEASETIASMLSGIRFKGLAPQYSAPAVLKNSSAVNASSLGIYPAASQAQPDYELYENPDAGFYVSLPADYVPFIQNNLGGVYSYTSFKINPNQILSITSEPLPSSADLNSCNYFMVASLNLVNMMESGAIKYGDNIYSHFAYNISDSTDSKAKQFFYDYYIENEDGSRLYKLQLQSSIAAPGANVRSQLEKILASFRTIKTSSSDSISSSEGTSESVNKLLPDTDAESSSKTESDNASSKAVTSLKIDAAKIDESAGPVQTTPSALEAPVKYVNAEEGYSFTYPGEWKLEDVSRDIAHDRLRLVDSGLSGSLEILVQESELKQSATFIDIIKSVDGLSANTWSSLTTGYIPPFAGMTSKLLFSDFSIDGSIIALHRLIAFTDDNSRNRLCYSTDILKGRKLYSMFITAGEYMTNNGWFNEAQINELISEVAASFRIETTKESEERKLSGESRNRKIVFLENYLKENINSSLAVASVGEIQPDNTMLADVGSTTEGGVEFTDEIGFYKVKLDYQNKKIELVSRVLKRDILFKELSDILLKRYQDKTILDVSINIPDMTILFISLENQFSSPVTDIFRINAYMTGSSVQWETEHISPDTGTGLAPLPDDP